MHGATIKKKYEKCLGGGLFIFVSGRFERPLA